MAHVLSYLNHDQMRPHYADLLNDWIAGPEKQKQETEIFNFCSQCVDRLNSCLITKHCLSLVLRFAAGLILARHNGDFRPVVDLVIDESDLLKERLDAFNKTIDTVKSTFEESRNQFIYQDDIQIEKQEVAVSEFDESETKAWVFSPEADFNSEDLNATTNDKLEEQESIEDQHTRPAVEVIQQDDSTSQEDSQKDNQHEAGLNSDENVFKGYGSSSKADINSVDLNASTKKRRKSKEHSPKVSKYILKDGVKYKKCSLAGCNEDYEVGNSAAYREHGRKFHRYTCDMCGQVLFSRTAIVTHVRLHDEEKAEMKCDFCERTFTTDSSMMMHVREAHDNDGSNFECQYCGIGFMIQKDLLAHLDNHTECKYCDEKLIDHSNWINHNRSKHSDMLLTCDQCDDFFLSLELLDRHKRRTHYKDKNEEGYTICPINNASFHQCSLCSLQFTTEKFELKHNEQIHANPESGKQKHLTMNRRTKGERKHGCDICGRMYRTKGSMRSHRYKEHNMPQQTCICDVCGQKFKHESYLNTHMANKHTTEQPFRCEHCPRAFSQASALKEHAKSHFAEKIHGCPHCDFRSKQLNALKNHIARKHTTDRPFKCPKCDKGFVNKYDLRSHIPMHNTAKPFQCHLCEQAFRRHFDVRKHLAQVHADKKGIEWHPVRNPTAHKN